MSLPVSGADKNRMLRFYKTIANDLIDKHQRYDWAISYLNLAMEIDQNEPEIIISKNKKKLFLLIFILIFQKLFLKYFIFHFILTSYKAYVYKPIST